MIRTKNIITSIEDIPVEWIFETYVPSCPKLSGQEVTMASPFSPTQRTGSFTLFFEKKQRYFFKCFSSSKGGDGFDFVQEYFKLKTKQDAISKVIKQYEEFLKSGVVVADRDYQVYQKYKVDSFELRVWNKADQKFWWDSYGIESKILDSLNISPLAYFEMTKEELGQIHRINIKRFLIYGYFNKRGELCRIYQPGVRDAKCIKVKSFIQGDDQLKGVNNLLIIKSMKDIAGFNQLDIPDWEAVAPDSENDLLPVTYIDDKKKRYKKIRTMMDPDEAGQKATQEYVKKYEIPGISFKMGPKDLTDAMQINRSNLKKVRTNLIQSLEQ